MVRLTLILLCFLVAAAAAGRYQAEVSVRETRRQIQELDKAREQELSEIQLLRAEVAYLEGPDRLAKLAAERMPDLRPVSAGQLMSAEEFVIGFGNGADIPARRAPPRRPDGAQPALAMAELSDIALVE
jgi:hypothetical protein